MPARPRTIRRSLLILFILPLIFALPSKGYERQKLTDPYSLFLKYVGSHIRHWNPDITLHEIECYSWSTWEGVNGDPDLARAYFAVCCEESGMKFIENKAGMGWAGATWKVVRKALFRQGVSHLGYITWAEKHPYETNRFVASWFVKIVKDRGIEHWHNSPNPDNNMDYVEKVSRIAKTCGG